jgi:Na+-transporting NADH:ubiquinone oxidoreductase subunit NqrC
MESDLLDKLLILLLITVLPVSIFLATNYQKKIIQNEKAELEKEQMIKVTETVKEIRAHDMQVKPEIEIEQVYYATESSKLVVTGTAPLRDTIVMVSTVLTGEADKKDAEATQSGKKKATPNVLGQAVDVVAIDVDEDGNFTFVKKVESEDARVIDIRFDQDSSSATVQYNLKEQKQTK